MLQLEVLILEPQEPDILDMRLVRAAWLRRVLQW